MYIVTLNFTAYNDLCIGQEIFFFQLVDVKFIIFHVYKLYDYANPLLLKFWFLFKFVEAIQ